MKPSAWLALVFFIASSLAWEQSTAASPADAPDKQTDYNKIVDHFFAMVKTGSFTDAAHVLVDTNPQDAFNVDKHESIAVPLEKIQDAFGSFKEFEILVNKTLGDGVGYVYGLAIYERSPIRFEFMFYKEGDDWRLLHVDFNLNYVPEIRDLAGIHIPATPTYTPPATQPAPAAQPGTPAPNNSSPAAKSANPSTTPTPSTPAAPSGSPTVRPSSSPTTTPRASAPSPSPQN